MNAAVLADGWTEGGVNGARAALDRFWERVSCTAASSPLQRSPLDRLMGRRTLDTSPAYIVMDLIPRVLSPYGLNPFGFNPLGRILAGSIAAPCIVVAALPLGVVVAVNLVMSFVFPTNVHAGLTGSASGGLTIALDALAQTYMTIAAQTDLSFALMHRVAVIGSGTLDVLPHNGAIVTLLAVCGITQRESHFDIVMTGIVNALLALVAVIVLGTPFGSR